MARKRSAADVPQPSTDLSTKPRQTESRLRTVRATGEFRKERERKKIKRKKEKTSEDFCPGLISRNYGQVATSRITLRLRSNR